MAKNLKQTYWKLVAEHMSVKAGMAIAQHEQVLAAHMDEVFERTAVFYVEGEDAAKVTRQLVHGLNGGASCSMEQVPFETVEAHL